MGLKEQLLSFLFSFLYGFVVIFAYKISYKYLYFGKNIYKFLNSLLFMIDLSLIYFKMFYIINGGIINIYFILITVLTFIYFKDRIRKIKKNK